MRIRASSEERVKVLFLDVNGVLGATGKRYIPLPSEHKIDGEDEINPECMKHIVKLFELNKDMKIVISSDWRIHYYNDIRRILKKYLNANIVVGHTPVYMKVAGVRKPQRIEEIHNFIANNLVNGDSFCVLDDTLLKDTYCSKEDAYKPSDLKHTEYIMRRLVRTDESTGIDERDMESCNELLKEAYNKNL